MSTLAIRLAAGIGRRFFRRHLEAKLAACTATRGPGRARLWGYGLAVEFPDELVWIHQMKEIFRDDCYGVRELAGAPVVIDAGANIGTFSLYALWRCPRATVIAVEPDPRNRAFLERNVAGQQAGSVRVVPAALAAAAGTARLAGESSDTMRLSESAAAEAVDSVTLSSLIAGPVDLLKMDIEGAELGVLREALPRLREVRRLVVECHQWKGRPSEVPELCALAREAGFTRLAVTDHREFDALREGDLEHCCLLKAWRVP